MRHTVKGLIVGAATGVLGALFALSPLGADFEQDIGLPWLFTLRGPIEAPPEAMVVAINSGTGERMGLPPMPRDWPRSIHGELVRSLSARGASVIVFDLDFHRSRSADDEAVFAEAIADAGSVILFQRVDGKTVPIEAADGSVSGTVWVENLLSPVPVLAEAARGLAPFPLPKTQVAVYRFWAFKPSVGDAPTLPSLALQVHVMRQSEGWLGTLRKAGLGDIADLPETAEGINGAIELDRLVGALRQAFQSDPELMRKVAAAAESAAGPTDAGAGPNLMTALARLYGGPDHRLLNFYGPPGSISTLPYHLALQKAESEGAAVERDLAGRVVFVGFSDLYDPGQPDRFFTVFTRDDGVDLSGVEIAATAFGNLLTDRSLRAADTPTTVLILFALGLLSGGIVYLLPAMVGVPLALALGLGYGTAAQLLFNTYDTWLPLATPILLQLPLALFIGLMGQYFLERRQKEAVSQAIGYYLPETVARALTEKGVDADSLNRVIHGVCLATDMSGFTTIAEGMAPKELALFMNSYFEAMSRPLQQHDVDITEFHADTIMCAWTSSEPDADKRRNAVLAALEVVAAVERFNQQHGSVDLYARIGLAEGPVYVGHTGGGGTFAYSILGDSANTAARIESLNKQVATHLLATRSVVLGLEDEVLFRSLGRFQLVGKSDPVEIVEVVAPLPAAPGQQELCDRFAEARNAFDDEDWALAARRIETLLGRHPKDGPSRFLLGLCRRYHNRRPEEEDPTVIRMVTK